MDDFNDGKSEQTKEIEAALGKPLNEQLKDRPSEASDEWEKWAELTQIQIEKLLSDNRTLKIGIGVVAFGCAFALGVGAMTSKAMSGLMGAVKQLGDNQMEIANWIGMSGPASPAAAQAIHPDKDVVAPTGMGKMEDIKTVDIDPDAVVGKPYEGPASEASEATKAQLAEDQAAGIIDLAKEKEEPS